MTALAAEGLRTDDLIEPLGLGTAAPALSWRLRSSERGRCQAGYEVEVASRQDFSCALWTTGWRRGDEQRVRYGGAPLPSRQHAWWRVRVEDERGGRSAWSPAARFEVGLLQPSDWSAEWITHPAWASPGEEPAALPVLARDVHLPFEPGAARLYVSGLGAYEAHLNGERVGDAELEPPYDDFRRRAGYRVHDVTALLRRGANALAISLGTGIAHVTRLPGRYTKLVGTIALPRAIAQLEVAAPDGEVTRVVTDASWRAALGPTTRSHWYGGEDHDARRQAEGWRPAAVVSHPVELAAPGAPPIRAVEAFPAVEIGRPAGGVRVFDLGVNIAGRPRIELTAAAGQEISLWPGELLDAGGRVTQRTTGSPIVDTWMTTEGAQGWHPRFTYHGFRYLEVHGLAEGQEAAVEGVVLRAANERAGSFSCSDPVLDGIHRIVDRAVQSNMASTLTDCPHREKLGWLEQAHLLFEVIARGYDVAAYARRLVRLILDAQTVDGLVPSIAPEYAVFEDGFRDDVNWGGAIVHLPWRMYLAYGDADTLRLAWPGMRRYLAYVERRVDGGIHRCGLGDWIALDESTPPALVATWGYQRLVATMARVAGVIGEREDAASLGRRAERIAAAFHETFCDPGRGAYGSGSQAGCALALDMGAVPAAERERVMDALLDAIAAAGDRLTVGEIALPALLRVLSAAGRDEVIHRVVTRTDVPGYGWQLAHGATALTEAWDGPTGNLSQNHMMLGAIDEWLTRVLAGIDQGEGSAGWRRSVIRPVVVGDLVAAAASIPTPYGTLASSWRLTDDRFALEVEVPVGTEAVVELPRLSGWRPDGEAGRVGGGRWTFGLRRAPSA